MVELVRIEAFRVLGKRKLSRMRPHKMLTNPNLLYVEFSKFCLRETSFRILVESAEARLTIHI